jgi:hypothetical protein
MPVVHSAESAAKAAHTAPHVWIRLAEARRIRLPAPWVESRVDKVNGEDAQLLLHPGRERAVARLMDGDPLTLAEASYLVQAGFAR